MGERLVAQKYQAGIGSELPSSRDVVVVVNIPSGVDRRVDIQDSGPRVHELSSCIPIRTESIRDGARKLDEPAAGAADYPADEETRLRHEHLIARLEERLKDEIEGMHSSIGNKYLVGGYLEALGGQVVGDDFAQAGFAIRWRNEVTSVEAATASRMCVRELDPRRASDVEAIGSGVSGQQTLDCRVTGSSVSLTSSRSAGSTVLFKGRPSDGPSALEIVGRGQS